MSDPILATLDIDMGNASTPIDLSAYGHFLVTGMAADHLAIALAATCVIQVRDAAHQIAGVSLQTSTPVDGGAAQFIGGTGTAQPVRTANDLHVQVSPLVPGNSVKVSLLGIPLP